jgi:RNA polymerase sigma-70 factor (ECF subfamily)
MPTKNLLSVHNATRSWPGKILSRTIPDARGAGARPPQPSRFLSTLASTDERTAPAAGCPHTLLEVVMLVDEKKATPEERGVCVRDAMKRLLKAFPVTAKWLTSQRFPLNDAQDAVQEALMSAITQLHYRLIREPERWLRTAARYAAVKAARRQRRMRPLVDGYAAKAENDEAASNEELAALAQAIPKLSEEDQKILGLVHFKGLNYREVAEEVEVDPGTARRRYYKALKNLRLLLGLSDNSEE